MPFNSSWVDAWLITRNRSSLHYLTYQSAQDYLSQSPRFLISVGFPWSPLVHHLPSHLFFWLQLNPSPIPFLATITTWLFNWKPRNHPWLHYLLTQLPLSFLFGLSSWPRTFQWPFLLWAGPQWNAKLTVALLQEPGALQPRPLVFTGLHLPLQPPCLSPPPHSGFFPEGTSHRFPSQAGALITLFWYATPIPVWKTLFTAPLCYTHLSHLRTSTT